MEKIKVVQLIVHMGTGGAQKLVEEYCLLLDKNQFEVTVIAIHKVDSVIERNIRRLGIRIFYLDSIIDDKIQFSNHQIKRLFHYLLRGKVLNKLINEIQPDVIHCHLEVCELVKQIETNARLFLTIHSQPDKYWSNNFYDHQDYLATKYLIEKKHLHLIALHEQQCQELKKRFPKADITILNNGVIISDYLKPFDRQKILRDLGIDENAIIFGHVGRFAPMKNHKFLIEIFEQIKRRLPQAELLLIGTGTLQGEIRELVEIKGLNHCVKFLNDRSDVPALLSILDLFIFPSVYEGLSVTLIEAQISGIKCLVSDTVDKTTKISNLIYFLSLKEKPEDWAKRSIELLNSSQPVEINTRDWDMRNIVHKLEKMYIG